ncbi:F-box/WD repeat-containing protein 4 isoform X2 [Anthonomus grandis grandis]|uniref:F-box/WD repeat-containing protein 4 isoform X2 n=1 Tax=Anthonomus grandis grandis TaxID=2921223 RepID=UPI0021651234|nr:F-box/WD repeat-containing protein 4 isoform X2 [Anthonomus grandis grandis]
MSQCCFNDLSTELLIYIFNFLEIPDLSRLRLTCRRFYDVINAWDNVLIKTTTVVTNQINETFLARCGRKIPTKLEKLRLQYNWKNGIYSEKSLFFVRKKYMPWLKLERETLWFGRGSKIYNYKRTKDNIIFNKPNFVLTPQYRHSCVNVGFSSFDVTRFTVRGSILAAGLSDGGVYVQNLNNKYDLYIDKPEPTFTSAVDISPDGLVVASAMRNDCFKIFSLHRDPLELTLIHTQDLGQRAWCVSYNENQPLFACGTSAGCDNRKSVWIYDAERYTELMNLKLGHYISATLDIKWESPHCIWSCGNDSHLRRWDIRTGHCVQKFHDAFGAGLYCLDLDYNNSVMVGTYLHARVALWDIRTNRCVQLYFMRTFKGDTVNSPVYSLSFDSEYLFAAVDQNLNILDFNVYDGQKRDYVKMLCWAD